VANSPGIRLNDPCRCRVGQFICRGMTCSGELKAFLYRTDRDVSPRHVRGSERGCAYAVGKSRV
jgi:hypothetical protein